MDPASDQHHGYVGGQGGSGGMSPFYTPILYNAALYQILQEVASGGTFVVNVYQSNDLGVTWTRLDLANGPTRTDEDTTAGFYFDGNHTVIAAWLPTGGVISGSPGDLTLQNFDLSTGLWGAQYGTTSPPSVYAVQQCFLRPDGSIIVFTSPTLSGGFGVGCQACVWDGTAWTTFACDTNISSPFEATGNMTAAMDSTGNIHLFIIARITSSTSELFYQLVTTANGLGTFTVLQTGAPNLPSLSGYYQPAIVGDNLIIGLVDDTASYSTIAVGTPLSGPTFTTLGAPGVDPVSQAPFFRIGAAIIAADDTGIYAAYMVQSASDSIFTIRLCFTPNLSAPLTGWDTAITAFDGHNLPPESLMDPTTFGFLGISRVGGNTFGSVQASPLADGPAEPTQFWLGVDSPPTPPTPPPIIASAPFAGSKQLRMCRPKNCFDDTLWLEEFRLRNIKFPPPCSIPNEYRNLLPWDDTFGAIPVQAKPLNITGAITTPPTASGDVNIFERRIPPGYDALITGLFQFYTGAGFVQGSGDIVWRIQVDQHYMKDWGASLFALGNPQLPIPMTEGMIVWSGETVRYVVNIPNLSGLIQVGQSTIVVGLLGFMWPR